jgi:cephalosporin hydroxylase
MDADGPSQPMRSVFRAVKSWLAHDNSASRASVGAKSALSTAPPKLSTPFSAKAEQEVRSLLSQGKLALALRTARRARADAPGAPGLAYLHGLSLDHVGRHEEALEAYTAELAANPGHVDARVRCQHLETALAPVTNKQVPSEERSWHTSLPRPTLLRLQKSLHSYQYRGIPLLKNPFDLALYPRLLWQLKPHTVIEIGSKSGGSGLWLGDLLTSFGIEGHVYSVDIVKVDTVSHPRVTFLEGDGRALGETLSAEFLQGLPHPWLVIEDADHAYETSSAVLKFFDSWLQPQEYIVVEDGIISDLSDIPDCNSGPHRALKEFLAQHREGYDIDADYCDFFGYNLTWCTNGFLKKLGPKLQTGEFGERGKSNLPRSPSPW